MPEQNSTKYNWKTVRVFISSTFRDFHAERDYLVKYVFPELRQYCEQYKLHLVDIDLRWGVTREEAETGKVLDICLDEIDNSRPFFICLLGNRYGWIPNSITKSTINIFPSLSKKEGLSVTHLEIEHAALNPLLSEKEKAPHSFFYFRDAESLPNSRKIKRKERAAYKQTFFEDSKSLKTKLTNLKTTITQHFIKLPERIFYYKPSFDINLTNPEDDAYKGRFTPNSFELLGNKVKEQLKQAIQIQYKNRIEDLSLQAKSDYLLHEHDLHETFVENRTQLFIGRSSLLQKITNYAQGTENKVLAVYGESGSGKSALLSQFYKQYTNSPNNTNVLFIPHFVGATKTSSSHYQLILRICHILKNHFDFKATIPFDIDSLTETFHSFLNEANQKVIILIDGLNQLDAHYGAHSLSWLPSRLPHNVRIIASSLDGQTKISLQAKTALSLNVTPLTHNEQKDIIRQLPNVFAKTLETKYIELLSNKTDQNGKTPAENPLYLKLAIEELRVFGSFEKLESFITDIPTSVIDMFGFVINRLSNEHGIAVVERFFCLLECSRYGLTLSELADLMSETDTTNQYLVILRQVRNYLHNRAELIDFFHAGFSKAVSAIYFNESQSVVINKKRDYHKVLSDYFSSTKSADRKIHELPYQLAKAHEWEELSSVLSELDFFKTIWKQARFDVLAYWKSIHDNSSIKIVDVFAYVLTKPLEYKKYLHDLGLLFADMDLYDETTILHQALKKQHKETGEYSKLIPTLINQANIYRNKGKLNDALNDLLHAERLAKQNSDTENLAIAISNQSDILIRQGELKKALSKIEESETIAGTLNNKNLTQAIFGIKANIYQIHGNKKIALEYIEQAETICKDAELKDQLASLLFDKAAIFKEIGDYKKACELFNNAIEIYESLGKKRSVANGELSKSEIYTLQSNFDNAIELILRAKRIYQEIGDESGVGSALLAHANVLIAKGKVRDAQRFLRQAKTIFEKTGDVLKFVSCINSLSDILRQFEEYSEALDMLDDAEKISRNNHLMEQLQVTIGNKAIIYRIQNKLDEALHLNKEKEDICRKMDNKKGLAISLGNIGNIYYSKKEYDKAISYHKQKSIITKELGNIKSYLNAIGNQAAILMETEEYVKALDLLKEQEKVSKEINSIPNLIISLTNLAKIHAFVFKEYQKAKAYCEEVLPMYEKTGLYPSEKSKLIDLYEDIK